MRRAVGGREINAILEVTDRLGIHREQVVIPLAAGHPGSVRFRADGKLEILVEADADFDDWLSGLEKRIGELSSEG